MKASTRDILKGLPDGYTLSRRGQRSGHLFVLRPDGEKLRDGNGVPVKVVGTPSDRRSIKKSLARAERAIRETVESGPQTDEGEKP